MELTLVGEKVVVSESDEAHTSDRRDGHWMNGVRKITMGDDEASQSMPIESVEEVPMDEGKGVATLKDEADDNEKRDKDDLDKSRLTMGGDDRTPQMGMVFKSYEEVVNFYKLYALRIGFGVAVRKSSFAADGLCRRLVLVCTKGGKGRVNKCYQSRPTAKTNCQAMLIVKLWGDGLLHVVEANLEHNHPVSPSTARFLRCYQKMPSGRTKDLVMQGGHENLRFGDKDCIDFVEGECLKLGEGDDEAIYNFFARMQIKNPNFFYLLDLNLEGHLRNVFWADSRSRTAYQYFSDVISIDTTFLKEKFDVPLVLFIGMNHHGQLVLLGCGLLSNEARENYIWLFKAWLTCMLGHPPNALITDYCKSIRGAVAEVFPGVQHRICLWQVMNCIPEKLREFPEYREIKKALEEVAYASLKVDEFEDNWRKLLNGYGLEDNEWLNSLYEIRRLWVPVFLKDTFWAELPTAQHNECIGAFFDGYLYPQTSLKQFFSKYEMALQDKYEMEAHADFEIFHKSRLSVSKFPMEEQLANLYTLNIFKKFQDELKATVYCHVSLVKIDGSVSTFAVKECAYMEDGEKIENKDHEVLYNTDEFEVQCICGSFQSRGILCRHALAVFKLQQVYEIPSQYIFSRWRKDFKRLHALAHLSNDVVGNNLMERYDHLSIRCLHLAEFGIVSDEKYQLALKLIREVEKSLLDDNTFQDLKRRLLPLETRSNESDENHVASQLGIFGGNKNPSSTQVKRRGRPPKKKKEADVEAIFGSSKDKDSLTTSLVGSQSDATQTASTASHLGTHMGTHGGVDLMEEVSPNELSFGSHFGLHVNHHQPIGNESAMRYATTLQSQFGQQAIGNQSRMQWIYQQMLQEDQTPFSRRTG